MTPPNSQPAHDAATRDGGKLGSSEINEYVTSAVKRSGSSFYWAMRLSSAHKRNALFAIYAFCREVDDIADEPGEPEEKRVQLERWREEVRNLYKGQPKSTVSRALAEHVIEFDLRETDFMSIIEGMEMAASDHLRIANMTALESYCDRVACSVGRLCNRVFGLDDDTGDRLADQLGQALQLTNILRDVGNDAERDHIYLPLDLLNRHGITDSDARNLIAHPALPAACAELAELIERRFDSAREILNICDQRRARPAKIMMEVYFRLFRRLARHGWSWHGEPIKLTKFEKIWIGLRYGFLQS